MRDVTASAADSATPPSVDHEALRLESDSGRRENWKRWGPYLSERQWGTVREDYSADGDCWNYLTHDHARSRAYRWGEDGLLGIADRQCRLCFALALWNGKDAILKERLFGVTGPEGNHGEDVKEHYFYLDSTPTHSYMRAIYKYPIAEYPYARLVAENRARTRLDREFEIDDTGAFEDGSWDVQAEYAKASPDDVLIRITATNRGARAATLHVLPTLWFRNTWSWGGGTEDATGKPALRADGAGVVTAEHETLGAYAWRMDEPGRGDAHDEAPPELLFTENETNTVRLFAWGDASAYVKDAFHERVVGGRASAVNPAHRGTKAAWWRRLRVPAGASATLRLRLSKAGASAAEAPGEPFGPGFDAVFRTRIAEMEEFYRRRGLAGLSGERLAVARQATAGLLWSKQFYHYAVAPWLHGDPAQPVPPARRLEGRNSDWTHLFNRDVISMPDKWEYPWYAAWDLAFQCLPFARVDPQFAKDQLVLFLREWYMHPSGQIPAYEFALGDVNPPVHAWACWRVYKMSAPAGKRDRVFLARTFQKLVLNFTWWVNRKDPWGKNIFAGGFLGLDNIGVFDRSRPLPTGGLLAQADGTAWMAFYCGTMLSMALELAREDPAYEDMASKFFEHFVAIADAMNHAGDTGLWDERDGFYYDQLVRDGHTTPLRVRSLVGVIPILAAEVLEERTIARLPGFRKRMEWFLEHRKDLARHIAYMQPGDGDDAGDVDHGSLGAGHAHRLLAIPSKDRLARVLRYVLDENEFLSPFGVRSLSRVHRERPFVLNAGGEEYRVEYTPAESTTALFGGNSNWRGPIWFPLNYLIIEALERYHHFYGPSFTVECPTGSGNFVTLARAAEEIRERLSRLFLPGADGRRPCHGDEATAGSDRFATDPAWRDLVLFHEHFCGDTGRGLGASHQTGWTALITLLLGEREGHRRC